MEEEFQINEYNTLPPEPIFQPDPVNTDIPELQTVALADQMRGRVDLDVMPSSFDYDKPDIMGSFGADPRLSMEGPGIGKEAYQELSDGTLIPNFEAYNPLLSADVQEARLADAQGAGSLWSRGMSNFFGQTGINILGGIAGAVNGTVQAMRMGSLDAFYNNDFNNYLEDTRKQVLANNRIYTPAGYNDLNFFQKMGTGKFYADELAGGVSFLAGTIVSEAIWGLATGGTGILAKGLLGTVGRASLATKRADNVRKAITESLVAGKSLLRNTVRTGKDVKGLRNAVIAGKKIQDVLNVSRFTATAAGYEASIESIGYLEEAEAMFEQSMLEKEGRLPTAQELGEFRDLSTENANYVFGANMALVGASNMMILGKLALGTNTVKPVSNSWFKKNVLGVGYKKGATKLEVVKPTTFQKVFSRGYAIGKPMFTEGFIEEGGQSVASKTAIDYSLSGFDQKRTGESLSFADSFIKGLEETYTTKEGLTEVGLGALIGILGGAASSGFKFNEYSQQRKRLTQDLEYINTFTNEKLINQMIFSNKVSRAVQGAEQAKAEGNLTSEMEFDTAAVTAVVEAKLMFEGVDEVIKDFRASMAGMSAADISAQTGMTEQEAEAWKSQRVSEFAEVAKDHAQNLKFASALLGDVAIAGLEGLDSFKQAEAMFDGKVTINKAVALRSAVAFALTTGKRADQFSQALAGQIKQMVAKEFSGRAISAIETNEVLRKLDSGTRQSILYQTAKKKEAQAKIDSLQNAIVKAQREEELRSKEEGTTKRARSLELAAQLEAATSDLARLEQELNATVEALGIETAEGMPITSDMLENQQENVNHLQKTIENMSQADPEFSTVMNVLINEYGRATERAKSYDETIKAIMNPKTRVNVLNGWLAQLIKKNKGMNEPTGEYFNNVVNTYYSGRIRNAAASAAQGTAQAEQEQATPVDDNQNPLEQPADNIAEELQNEIQKQPAKPVQKKKVAEVLKAIVADIISKDPFAKAKFTGVELRLSEVVPTQKELNRYNELLGKSKEVPEPIDIANDEARAREQMGITTEEFSEFKALNTKFNNWQLLSADLGAESTLAELLTLAAQVEAGFSPNPVQVETTVRDFLAISNSKGKEDTASVGTGNTVIAPDIVTAKKTEGQYQLSHMKPESLLEILPGNPAVKLFVVIDGRPVDIDTIPQEKRAELAQTPGTIYQLQTEMGQNRKDRLKVTINERQRLVVDAEAFEALLPSTNLEVLDFGTSNFLPVFRSNEDGNLSPLEGDFIYRSVSENETITLDKNAMYGMRRGEVLRTVVNLNDSYNASLKQNLDDGLITEEQFANELNIYLALEGATNDIVGSMRSIKPGGNENTPTFVKMHFIRRLAAKKALEATTSRVEVGVTVPLATIQLGTPIINVVRNENGTVSPQNLDFTDEALSLVVDYGYIQDGQYFLKNNLEVSTENGTFAIEASKRFKGQKVPVVVFEHRGRAIAFPVSLKTGERGPAEAMAIMQNPDISDTEKIIALNKLAAAANLDFTKYPITDFSSEESQEAVGELLGDIMRTQRYVDPTQWVEQDHNKQALAVEAEIAIDITNNPFTTPKGILDFSNLLLPTEREMELEVVRNLDNYTKKVHQIFVETEPFRDMTAETKFYTAFYDVSDGPDLLNEGYTFEQHNANLLVDAFQHPMSKPVKEALGDDLIVNIKNEIKQYKLIKTGLPTKDNLQKQLDAELAKLKNDNECQ